MGYYACLLHHLVFIAWHYTPPIVKTGNCRQHSKALEGVLETLGYMRQLPLTSNPQGIVLETPATLGYNRYISAVTCKQQTSEQLWQPRVVTVMIFIPYDSHMKVYPLVVCHSE